MDQETPQPDVSPVCLGKGLDSEPFLGDVAGVPPEPGALAQPSPQTSSTAVSQQRLCPRHSPCLLLGPDREHWVTHACTPAGSEILYPGHHSTRGELRVTSKTSKPNMKPPSPPCTASLCFQLLPKIPQRGKGCMYHSQPWTPCGEGACSQGGFGAAKGRALHSPVPPMSQNRTFAVDRMCVSSPANKFIC